jgi:hypothetical protein
MEPIKGWQHFPASIYFSQCDDVSLSIDNCVADKVVFWMNPVIWKASAIPKYYSKCIASGFTYNIPPRFIPVFLRNGTFRPRANVTSAS